MKNKIMARLYARAGERPVETVSDVAVAAGLPSYADSPWQIRQNGFKVGDDGFHSLRLGLHPQQRLLKSGSKGREPAR
jgi:hypothetical protein